MGTQGRPGRRGPALTSRHLSYANVVATLALFVALGGAGYAATQINGAQIKDRSIAGKKLELRTVTKHEINTAGLSVPHATTANNVSHLVVSNSALSRHRAARAANASGSAGGSLVTLSAGQTVTVLQTGPFTVTASCTDQGNNVFKVELDATANVDGWYAGAASPPEPAGAKVPIVQGSSSSQESVGTPADWLTAPDGQSLDFQAIAHVHEIGDCSFAFYAIG